MDNIAGRRIMAGDNTAGIKTGISKTMINQITLQSSETLPENSTLYNIDMRVAFGRVGLSLDDLAETVYDSGSVISILAKTKMHLSNRYDQESTVFLMKI